jgi:choline dehydrogenase
MSADFDYIIVGSGAGGGPLAANLAKAGFKVCLLEAGGDPCSESNMGRYMYEVPIFHGLSTEYIECAWDYFVQHYSNLAQQQKDQKYVPEKGGVWYPRAGTLGGCTAHNAMITVIPQDDDWNYIRDLMQDPSWDGKKMRGYFVRLENCQYVPRPGTVAYEASGLLSSVAALFEGKENWHNWAHGHGFEGWLKTSEADPKQVLKDPEIILALLKAVREALSDHIGNPFLRIETRLDPNDSRNATNHPDGLAFTPLAVANGKRNGPREYLLRIQNEFPNNLTIQKNSLATRIVLDGKRAVAVEFVEGRHLYKADRQAGPATSDRREVSASREIVIAAGAFNSPQLLKLSGIGPRAELEKFGIKVLVDLPGVGENLQDRYEVGVISEFAVDFNLLKGATFGPPVAGGPEDPFWGQWEKGAGIYTSNGALIGIIARSTPDKKEPDLYIFGLPGSFKGYVPGYSKVFERFRNRFTWAILKAHTNNTAGRVTLQSASPFDTPKIEFHYFDEGNDATGADLESVVKGVELVRNMNRKLRGIIQDEEVPGPEYDSPEKLREFIRNEAWGHHASCTNKIGTDQDELAVLDTNFRVRGTEGLRVVDASVFPKIPGYFIVSAVYMVSEKAFDVIEAASGEMQRS